MATINAREIKSVSVVKGDCLTPYDKNAIKSGFLIGLSKFETPQKKYQIVATNNPNLYEVEVTEKDDFSKFSLYTWSKVKVK